MRAEIDDLMPRGAQLAEQFLLQMKSTVIRGNANAHSVSPRSCMRAHETQQTDSRRCTSLRDQEPDWALYLSSTSLSSLHSIHRKSRWRPRNPRSLSGHSYYARLTVVLPPLGRRAPGHWPSESCRPESSHRPRATAQAL